MKKPCLFPAPLVPARDALCLIQRFTFEAISDLFALRRACPECAYQDLARIQDRIARINPVVVGLLIGSGIKPRTCPAAAFPVNRPAIGGIHLVVNNPTPLEVAL